MSTHLKHNKQSLQTLSEQLKASLLLNLDELNLAANQTGEYTSEFAGIHLASAFQPIYDIGLGDFHGHEALLRPKLGDIKEVTPDFAFTYADKSDKLVKLDRVSRTLHVLNYHEIFKENGLLFLNVHPSLLVRVNEHGKVFERILHDHAVATNRVVIEVRDFDTFDVATDLLAYEQQLEAAIKNYQDRGYKIAIDRFGSANSIVSRLWKLNPDYVKFDIHFLQQAALDATVRQALFGLVNFVKSLGAEPILAGVETKSQLHLAIDAGANLVQGYLFGQPSSARHLSTSDIIKRQYVQQLASSY
jgi:EAL domain-containing protein (putative c-di-GMP-specific phosphodiesterase class I)